MTQRLSPRLSADAQRKTASTVNQLIGRVSNAVSISVKDFGAIGDGVTDDGPAFTAALAFLNANAFPGPYDNGNQRLFIPKGIYWLNTTTLELHTTIILEGDGVGEAGGNATHLKWAADTTGIRVQDPRTTGDTASGAQDTTQGGAASIIRNLALEGGYNGSNDADYHGIQLRARASIRDCYIADFQGNGIHIAADTQGNDGVPVGNANNFEVYKTLVSGCRNGIYTIGGDANAGMVLALNAMTNREWGVNENGFLGNTYVACHTANNSSGPYQTTNLNARCLFSGCYSEGDQPPSSFAQDTLVLGGLHGAGVNAAARYISADSGGLKIYNGYGITTFSADSLNIVSDNTTQGFYRLGDLGTTFGFQVGNLGTYPLVIENDAAGAGVVIGTGLNISGGVLKTAGTQVVAARQTGTAANATDLATAITLVNDLKTKLIAHGLIS